MIDQNQIEKWADLCEREEYGHVHEDMDDGTIIGSFDVEAPLTEMGEIGRLQEPRKYYVYVRSNEGMKPHFHVFDNEGRNRKRNRKNGFHTCVEILKNSYFKHGPYTDDMDQKTRDALDSFMGEVRTGEKYISDLGKTNFFHTVAQWDENNAPSREMPNFVDPETIEKPDYANLQGD